MRVLLTGCRGLNLRSGFTRLDEVLSACGLSLRPLRRLLGTFEHVPPVRFRDVDFVTLRGFENLLPRLVPLGIGDAFDLIEASDRVTDVFCVNQRLLALLSEREVPGRQAVLLRSAQALALLRDLGAMCPGALYRAGLGDVFPGGFLLSFGGHQVSSRGRSSPVHRVRTRDRPVNTAAG